MPDFFKRPIVRIPVRYGLIAGLFGFSLMLVLYYMDRHPFLVPLFFDFRILLFSILLVFCLKEIRDFHQNGVLHFFQAMFAGFTFTLVFAFLCSLLLYVYMQWNPEFVSSFITLATAQAKTISQADMEQMGKGVYEELMASLQNTSGLYLARRFFFQSFILSFFLSLIISVILRSQPKSQ